MSSLYQHPEIEEILILTEGVLCQSGSIDDMPEIDLLEEL